MTEILQQVIEKIRALGDDVVTEQMYYFPGFHPEEHDPDAFFAERNIDFDGDLFISFPVKLLFQPLPASQIRDQEKLLGAALPADYRAILETFGQVHLPGDHLAGGIQSPVDAREIASQCYGFPDSEASALAISFYHDVADGNAIGYLKEGNQFAAQLYRFDHEKVNEDAPEKCASILADSLSAFLISYIDSYLAHD